MFNLSLCFDTNIVNTVKANLLARTDVRGIQVEPLYLSLLVTEPEVPLVIPSFVS